MKDKPHGPPPVEALSEVAWARVERGLWSRMDHPAATVTTPRSRRWIWLAVPALAAAAVLAITLRPSTEGKSELAGDSVSRVVSGSASSSISFGDAHVELDANSAVVMSRDGGPNARLEYGAAWFTVAPRGSRPPFVVLAGDARVGVIGTHFRVARDGERVDVRVDHGVVGVQFHGIEVEIGASQQWSSARPSEVVTMTAELAAPVRDEPRAGQDTVSAGSASHIEQPTIHSGSASRPEQPAIHSSSAPAMNPRPESSPPPIKPAPVSATGDREQELFDQLSAIEAREPEAALGGYLKMSRGTSRWSELALYAAARLATDRRDPRARTLLTIYLQRFPKGANAVDARQLLDHLKGEAP